MSSEEASIVDFLTGSPETAFSRREISRRAVKRRVFEENPRWADQSLDALVAQNVVEINDGGQYQIKKTRWQS